MDGRKGGRERKEEGEEGGGSDRFIINTESPIEAYYEKRDKERSDS